MTRCAITLAFLFTAACGVDPAVLEAVERERDDLAAEVEELHAALADAETHRDTCYAHVAAMVDCFDCFLDHIDQGC